MEWLLRVLRAVFGGREAIPADGWAGLTAMQLKQIQAMEHRLEVMENRFATLEAAHEREKSEHGECKRRLNKAENDLATLKAQVAVLMQRQTDGGS